MSANVRAYKGPPYIDLYDQFSDYVGGTYTPGDAVSNKYPSVSRPAPQGLSVVKLTTSAGAGTPPVLQTTVTADYSATAASDFLIRSKMSQAETEDPFYAAFSLTASNLAWAQRIFEDQQIRRMMLAYVRDCYLQFAPGGNNAASNPPKFTLTFIEPGLLQFDHFQFYKAVFIVEDLLLQRINAVAGSYA